MVVDVVGAASRDGGVHAASDGSDKRRRHTVGRSCEGYGMSK